jgi:hypothetical protein
VTKSYWQEMCVDKDGDKNAIKSWFSPLSDGMTPYEAAILCDADTDREKKIRAFMTDGDNRRYKLERTLGGKRFSITKKPLDAVSGAGERG